MRGRRPRWVPRGMHRVPAPGTLLAEADAARAQAAAQTTLIEKVPPPADTLAFDVAGSWTGPLPVREPAASRPQPSWVHAIPPLGDLQRVRDRLIAQPEEPPPRVVSEVVFHPPILGALRRDFEEMPGFRGTVLALTDASPLGFARLHERAPSTASGGKT